MILIIHPDFIELSIINCDYDKALDIIKEQLDSIKNGNVSPDELASAKQLVTSTLKLIPESGETLINYYYDKEMNNEEVDLQDFIEDIKKVEISDIVEVAKDVSIDTIYFLRD